MDNLGQVQSPKESHSEGRFVEDVNEADDVDGEYSFLQFHKVEDDNVTDGSNTKGNQFLTEPDLKASVVFDG